MNRSPLLLLACLLLSAGTPSCTKQEPSHQDEPAVRAFLENYFKTWSSQDMDGYAACFHETARVTGYYRQQESAIRMRLVLHHPDFAAPVWQAPTLRRT